MCINDKQEFYCSELLQSPKFVSLLIYCVRNFGCYKSLLYGIRTVDIFKKNLRI